MCCPHSAINQITLRQCIVRPIFLDLSPDEYPDFSEKHKIKRFLHDVWTSASRPGQHIGLMGGFGSPLLVWFAARWIMMCMRLRAWTLTAVFCAIVLYRPYYASCSSVCPVQAFNPKTKGRRKVKAWVNGSTFLRVCYCSVQTSEVKVPARQNLKKRRMSGVNTACAST